MTFFQNFILNIVPFVVFLISVVAVSWFMGGCIQRMCSKMNYSAPATWHYYCPFVNLYYLARAAGFSPWWIAGFFVPYVGIASIAAYGVQLARKFQVDEWSGLVFAVPFANLIWFYWVSKKDLKTP